ncbi:MAG: hypothetical protein WD824_02430 [Cyclobacteriaceae bacterium]
MKIKQLFLSVILAMGTQFCFAQADAPGKEAPVRFEFKPAPDANPLVILKSDNRTMEIDPKENEVFDMESIDKKWIKSISVLKGEIAKNTYGERASNGVLIVQLVDNYIFTKAIYKKIGPKN